MPVTGSAASVRVWVSRMVMPGSPASQSLTALMMAAGASARKILLFMPVFRLGTGFFQVEPGGNTLYVSRRKRPSKLKGKSRHMAKITMKFGGTSVADIERIRHVATLVKREVERGNQ